MASSSEINIPQLGILQSTGQEMKGYLDNGQNLEIAFKGEEVKSKNPQAGSMAGFSSWVSHRTLISNLKSRHQEQAFFQPCKITITG